MLQKFIMDYKIWIISRSSFKKSKQHWILKIPGIFQFSIYQLFKILLKVVIFGFYQIAIYKNTLF